MKKLPITLLGLNYESTSRREIISTLETQILGNHQF